MGDFTQSVIDFWDFLWPAVLHLFLTILVVAKTSPAILNKAKAYLVAELAPRVKSFVDSELSTTVGLPKLLPAVSAFVFIFVLVVISDLAVFIGKNTPPSIWRVNPDQYLKLERSEEILKIWRSLPDDSSISDLTRFVEKEWKDTGSESGLWFWEERVVATGKIRDYLKFYIFLSIGVFLLEMRFFRSGGVAFVRFLKTEMVLIILFSLTVGYSLHCFRGQVKGRISHAYDTVSATELRPVSNELNAERMREIDEYTIGPSWHFGLPGWSI